MTVYQDQIQLTTQGHGDMQDLTDPVQQVIWDSGIQVGMVNVFQLISSFILCVNLSETLSPE